MNTPVKHNEATIAQAKADANRFLSTVEIHIQHCGSIPTVKLEHLLAFKVLRDAPACAEAALAKIKEEKIGGHHLCEKGHGWVVDGQPCYLCQHANAVALSEERDKFAGLFAAERQRREKAEADLVATRLLLEDSELGCGRLNESARIGWSGALRLRDTRNRLIGELTEARKVAEIHRAFCEEALTLCEDTQVAAAIIVKMRQIRADQLDAAREAEKGGA